jgi:hypothetical protein
MKGRGPKIGEYLLLAGEHPLYRWQRCYRTEKIIGEKNDETCHNAYVFFHLVRRRY